MGTTTTNFALYKPTVGETGYGPNVDAAFDTLDNACTPFLYNAKLYGVRGDGVTDDGAAITTLLVAAGVTGGTVWFPKGTYVYATSPNFAIAGVSIRADRGALFKHTGSGNAFILDGGGSSGILGLTYEYLTVQGNSNSTNGIFVRRLYHCNFLHPRVTGCSTTGDAIQVTLGVANVWVSPRVTINEGLAPVPLNGIHMTRDGVGNNTTTQAVINPVFEGLTQTNGSGILIDFANTCQFFSGTSEANYNGITITGDDPTGLNSFVGTFIESNSNLGISLGTNCVNQSFTGIIGTSVTLNLGTNTNRNTFWGGIYNITTLSASSNFNTFTGVQFNTTLTDNGPTNEFINCTTPGGLTKTTRIRGGLTTGRIGTSYSASVAIDASQGNLAVITATNNTAFTVANPTNATGNQPLTITIKNTSGAGLGALTFDTLYKIGAAWTQPATGFSRSITFFYNGTNWVETSRTAADVSN